MRMNDIMPLSVTLITLTRVLVCSCAVKPRTRTVVMHFEFREFYVFAGCID